MTITGKVKKKKKNQCSFPVENAVIIKIVLTYNGYTFVCLLLKCVGIVQWKIFPYIAIERGIIL